MGSINRDAVLSQLDLGEERIEIEGIEGEWIVRELSGTEQSKLITGLSTNGHFEQDLYYKRMISACVVDEGGNRIFDEADVAKFPRWLLTKLNVVCDRVNKMGELEDVEKNSEATGDDSFTSV